MVDSSSAPRTNVASFAMNPLASAAYHDVRCDSNAAGSPHELAI
jgi:hypothetical protein